MWRIYPADGRWFAETAPQVLVAGSPQSGYHDRALALRALLTAWVAAGAPIEGGTPMGGVLAIEGQPTSDGRRFDRLTVRQTPLPFMTQRVTDEGHDGAVITGRIDEVTRDDAGRLQFTGVFDGSPDGQEAARLVADGLVTGVSMDATGTQVDFECTEFDDDGYCVAEITVFPDAEVMGATQTPFPAFADCFVELRDATAAEAPAEEEPAEDAAPEAEVDVAAAASECACHSTLTPVAASGNSSTPPVPGAIPLSLSFAGTSATVAAITAPRCSCKSPVTAAAPATSPLDAPPADWFTDPGLTEPTPLTVTDDGQVFGHVAAWDTCHTGIGDSCVRPPRSASSYAYFRTGVRRTANGDDVPTGVLTIGGGHASLDLGFRAAVEHYDDTTTGWADVAAGEDAHGIWVAGAVRPGLSDELIMTAKATSPSGDWRAIAGALELVAVLNVNVPGFPVPRARALSLAASGSGVPQLLSLVAAGALPLARLANQPWRGEMRALREELSGLRAIVASLQTVVTPLRPAAREAAAARGRGAVHAS